MINGFESSSDSDSQQWAAFYRMHIDDFSVKYTPALRIVALDVFLSGWDDWSRWTSKRLQGYRERYPDIYRIAAVYFIRAVQRYESEERTTRGEAAPAQDPLDHTGVFLRKLIDPHISYKLRGRVAGTVGWIRNDIDALDFVVKAYLATDDEGIRYQCLGVCGRLNQTISKDERLAFWLSYVNTPDRKLRGMAIGGIGNSRRRPRDVPLAEHPDRELVELLRRVASTDPDEQIRRYALDAIKSLVDDSPPPGLIDYSKPQGRK